MDYEKKYKQLHNFINDLYPHMSEYCKEKVCGFLPELAESEDERIRKALINVFSTHQGYEVFFGASGEDILSWLEKQGEQKETNLVEILKHYPRETELYSPLYGKLWLAEVDEKHKIITCYKHRLDEGCTRAILEQEDTVSFYSNGTTGLPDFSISKDCMLFLYDIEKQGEKANIHQDAEDDLRRQDTIRVLEYARSLDAYNQYGKESINKDIAWLKKQYVQKPIISNNALREGIAHFGITQYQIDNWLKKYVDIEGNYYDGVLRALRVDELYKLQEKQGEQKPINKVEPKFKVGDWCIDNEDGTIFQIVKVLDNTYIYKTNEGKEYSCSHYSLEIDAKLWTIQDAKDGDVLAEDSCMFIIEKMKSEGMAIVYCCLFDDGYFDLIGSTLCFDADSTYPATKEQRDLLFQKMHEAGYEWDFEKKELKKKEQEPINECNTHEPTIDEARKWNEAYEKGYSLGYENGRNEQKPIDAIAKMKQVEWSEEDERNLRGIICEIEINKFNAPEYDMETYDGFLSWLKSLKDRV